MKKNLSHFISSDKPIVIPIPTKSLLPDIHSCTNRCSPYVIADYTIEDWVELNQNNDDGLAYRNDDFSHEWPGKSYEMIR